MGAIAMIAGLLLNLDKAAELVNSTLYPVAGPKIGT